MYTWWSTDNVKNVSILTIYNIYIWMWYKIDEQYVLYCLNYIILLFIIHTIVYSRGSNSKNLCLVYNLPEFIKLWKEPSLPGNQTFLKQPA